MSKKGENIYKRKDGRWEARYIKGYRPDCKAIYGYCYAKTYREAKEKVCHARAELENHGAWEIGDRKKSLSTTSEEWLRLKRSQVKEATYTKYRTAIDNHIRPELGNCPMVALTASKVEQFGYGLLHEKGLSRKTVKDVLTVLHGILKYGEKQIPAMPHIQMTYPREAREEMRVLSRQEQETLTEYLQKDMDLYKFGTLLTLLTGLRVGELCALRWRNISLEEGTLSVKGTMQRLKNPDTEGKTKTRVVISDPKSFSSARVIPLSPLARKLCREFAGEPDAFALSGRVDKLVEPRIMQHRMDNYARDCGLENVHFHTLRHSFATRCVEVGFEIKSLSEILGHASPQITLARYVHSSLDLKRENMAKLEKIGY